MKKTLRNPFSKEHFARNLSERRKAIGLTQDDIADMLEVSRSTYQNWENPKKPQVPADYDHINCLCEIYRCSQTFLFTGKEGDSLNIEPHYRETVCRWYARYSDVRHPAFSYLMRRLMSLSEEAISSLVIAIDCIHREDIQGKGG